MPKITFVIDGQKQVCDVTEGQTVLEAALEHGIPMEHACGGNGFCTTCRCKVHKGAENLSPRNDREQMMGVTADPDRLGCQAKIMGDVTVEPSED